MKRTHYIQLLTSILLLGLVIWTSPAVDAQGGFDQGFSDVFEFWGESGINFTGSLEVSILNILRVVTALLAVLALAAIIYGGFMYVTSAGNEQRAETGKKVILYAIIGLVVISVAGVLVNIVINAL